MMIFRGAIVAAKDENLLLRSLNGCVDDAVRCVCSDMLRKEEFVQRCFKLECVNCMIELAL